MSDTAKTLFGGQTAVDTDKVIQKHRELHDRDARIQALEAENARYQKLLTEIRSGFICKVDLPDFEQAVAAALGRQA